jgi:hypothetical protein
MLEEALLVVVVVDCVVDTSDESEELTVLMA